MKKKPSALHEVLKALADPTRLRILALLASGEICVCHIHTALNVPQPTASRHLAYLKKSALVEDRKVGLWKHYRLTPVADPAVQAVVDSAVRAVSGTVAMSRDCCRLTEAVRVIPSPLRPASPTPDSRATTR